MINFLKSLFKKKPKVEPVLERSPEEIANDAHRQKYRLEFLENVYFVQYYFHGEWYWLRILDGEYCLEDRRGLGLRIQLPEMLEPIITKHQNWIKGGKIFLPFK